MTTSSRRLSQRSRKSRPSQTPGKDKIESCQKSELKEFGRTANPSKLRGSGLERYAAYCRVVDLMNRGK